MRLEEAAHLHWDLASPEPLIKAPRASSILADPTLLLPSETPDSLWRLYAHALQGIAEYVSTDGREWAGPRFIVRNAMRANAFKVDDGSFRLAYEATAPFAAYYEILPLPWHSRLEMRASSNLAKWGRRSILLVPSLPWHSAGRLGSSVSNPCIVRNGDRWRLYYSASLVHVPDCGFNEPAYIGLAESDSIDGPYSPREAPLLGPETDCPWSNLGAGSIKVVEMEDGWLGFQNGIYIDASGASGSAIRLLASRDGLAWKRLVDEPILKPVAGSWYASHVYACWPIVSRSGIALYFNARDKAHWSRGSEAIGLALGTSV